jgi:hypothetical protein
MVDFITKFVLPAIPWIIGLSFLAYYFMKDKAENIKRLKTFIINIAIFYFFYSLAVMLFGFPPIMASIMPVAS